MMLNLDNLDFELDEDFPISPFKENNLHESSFTDSFWTGNKSDENPSLNQSKTLKSQSSKNKEKENATKDLILKLLESSDKKQENDSVSEMHIDFRGSTSKLFNTSYSPNKIFEERNHNASEDLGKRILTHRKFPGPAGLLPDKPLKDLSEVNVIVDSSLENISAERQKEAVILCSQTSSVFTEASYRKLASDFDLYKENCPLNKYTVDWVKKRALKKTLCGKKIPFLAVVLHNLDHGTPDPVITLRDQTGEIYGTLHREVWSELGEKLQPGAALALRQVGVLITGIARRQVHLNITNNNIINIYSYSNEENVETNCINKLDKSDLIKTVKECQISTSNQVSNSDLKIPSNPFSTLGGNKSTHRITSPLIKTNSSFKTPIQCGTEISKSSSHQNSRTSMGCPSNSKNDESKNYANLMTSMEDDMTDFWTSLDETELLAEKIINDKKDAYRVSNVEFDNNIRKRKMDSMDVGSIHKVHCPDTGGKSDGNEYKPPVKKMEFKKIMASKPLSQEETKIVEEVLDGIDFDDFLT